jgi:hypothetical protein
MTMQSNPPQPAWRAAGLDKAAPGRAVREDRAATRHLAAALAKKRATEARLALLGKAPEAPLSELVKAW